MAAFGEKIATSVVSEILKKLSSYPEKKIIGIWNVEKEFQKLEMTFGMLLAVLRDAEKRQDNLELVGCWLERLKDVAYEADDVLGEFSFEAIRMGIDMRIDHSKMEKVRGFFSNIHAVKFRSNMADKMKKIYEKLDDIGKDMERFQYILRGGNIDHSDQNDRAGPIITSPVIEDLHFLGRENEKSMLIDMLIGCSQPSSNEETLSVVSIVGIGGLGKTTLARIVYNHESVVAHFQKRMWVCVPRDFEIRKLRERMVQSLTGVKPQSSETDEVIQKMLDENIRECKFLLVLDNVWNADIGGWEKLRASLKMGIQQGSKIIVTTRDTSVASIIRTLPEPLQLKGLSKYDSLSLFETRAFASGGARKNPNTERIGRALVEKCKGVPLAIKSLGALMHSKTTDLDWESIQFSEIWKLKGQDNISSVLKLSYHDLPPPVKRCFINCSIFGKGKKFVKKTLIQLWMAEGLLQSSSSDDKLMEDVGLEYFKSLVWKSFLQDVETDKFGEEVACKMHDLVHDFAQSITRNECRIVEDFDNEDKPKVEETRRLLVVGHLGWSYGHANPIPIPISAKMFSNFKSLRVLVLSYAGIESLSSSIGELKQLRYLQLSGNKFATFPEFITKLYNLQTLKMLGTLSGQGILPIGITKMINLRHLEIDCGIKFPKGIGQLTNLQTLNHVQAEKITKAANINIEELRDLRHLEEISLKLDELNWLENASAANLRGKPRLRNLYLAFGYRPNGFDCDNELLESLQPHQNLISLSIFGFTGTKAPTWMNGCSYLSYLQNLKLDGCRNIKSLDLASLCSLRWLKISYCRDLTSLGLLKGLTALEDITIYRCDNLMSLKVPEEDGMPDLISLKELKIDDCGLETLPDGFFSLLTSLNTLEIRSCPRLKTLPESIRNLSLLRKLTVPSLALEKFCIEDSKGPDLLVEGLRNVPSSFQKFTTSECDGLATVPTSFENFSSLQKLTITQCSGLTALSTSFGNMPSLQELDISTYAGLAALLRSLGNLSSLQYLTFRKCNILRAFPENFGNLLALKNLTIGYCLSLAALPHSFGDLLNLQQLHIYDCKSLVALPESFGNLSKLQGLIIDDCGSLAALPESFGDLLNLQQLDIHDCESLVALPESFGNLLKLKRLSIKNCESLAALPESFGNLLKLKNLTIRYCVSLAALPHSFGDLLNLQQLHIYGCESLVALPESFGNLSELQRLIIDNCGSLAALPESFGNLLKLKRLTITNCESLAALPMSLGSSLKSLEVANCNALTALSENLGDLSSLTIVGCPKLVSRAEGICGLTSVAFLSISDCKSMKCFPLQNLISLKELRIRGLKNLEALPDGLRNLSSLIALSIEGCPRLMSLPDCFEGLTSLKVLSLLNLVNLTALPTDLGKLSSLENLCLDGCKNLKYLPKGIQNLTSLRYLIMIDCPQLKKRYRQHKSRGWPRIISHIPVIQTERLQVIHR